LNILVMALLLQPVPADALNDPALVPGQGLEIFSQALGSTLQWSDNNRQRFGNSLWVGNHIRLQREPTGGLTNYAVTSLERALRKNCTLNPPHYMASYEGFTIGSFAVDCDDLTSVFAYEIDGLGIDFYLFNRDGRMMATAGHDLHHAPRNLFVALDERAAEIGMEQWVPLRVEPLEFDMDRTFK